ncbi:MAG: putative tail fiber protein [Caudoviricetes sp.]|nr:MAG: putative tail fiber protein [Caudoviricetes sp.]
MADSNIGALPLAPNLADDSLLVMEQQGTAMKMTGAQLKDYAKQGVEFEFQGYLDEAKAAADSAEAAVSTVTGMTVEAKTLGSGQQATVAKSIRSGVVNLAFGLPKGEQGEPGPEGKQGARGPQGAPGTGLTILGHYDTEDALRGAVKAPEVGDAYGVGLEAPYDIYVFDGATLDWKNYGQLGGGSGGVIPENVVTSEGGASFEYGDGVGEAPHVVTFTYEEEPPLTAEDVSYGDETVKEAMDGLFTSVSDGKALLASAITDQGVPTAQDAAFAQMAENVRQISTGADTSDATATVWDILSPKTAYTASGKVTGAVPSLPAQIITPGTAAKSIANGQYLSGTQTIQGDANLMSANIKKGVSIFGVAGALESSFKATLTVKVEAGAQVTAKCGDKEISALSTTGTVVMELPSEGTWSVTAARGMTQYNTAVINVTSSYNAELTAEIRIKYYGGAPALSTARSGLAGVAAKNYALFAGGNLAPTNATPLASYNSRVVDAYNESLTHSTPTALSEGRYHFAATVLEGWVFFGGGDFMDTNASISSRVYASTNVVDAYDQWLTRNTPHPLSEASGGLGAASVGDWALFGGGYDLGEKNYRSSVYGYSTTLTAMPVSAPMLSSMSTSAVAQTVPDGEYALFATLDTITAYDKKLVRSTPTKMSVSRRNYAAATAGVYTLFAGGSSSSAGDVVDAYDQFLTRTTPQALGVGRDGPVGTTLDGYAIFTGGENPSVSYVYQQGFEVYDAYLVRTGGSQGIFGEGAAAAAIGEFALFAGGERNTSSSVSYQNYVLAFCRAE